MRPLSLMINDYQIQILGETTAVFRAMDVSAYLSVGETSRTLFRYHVHTNYDNINYYMFDSAFTEN